jgi:hypothetical protein
MPLTLPALLKAAQVTPLLTDPQLPRELSAATNWEAYPNSIAAAAGVVYFLGRRGRDKRVCLLWEEGASPAAVPDFCGEVGESLSGPPAGLRLRLLAGHLDHQNAAALRKHLPFTAPQLMGVQAAIGTGDRLGLATPAHVRAVRGSGLRPFFAQQSIREMTRTGRTPEEVMDTATFGVFQEGWREGFGADADHLKETKDIDACVAAGFTMFTIDPGDHVDDGAETDDVEVLRRKFQALPWSELEATPGLLGRTFADAVELPDGSVVRFDEWTLLRAAVKYGRALAHTAMMYRHLADKMSGRPFELEMSVDETATPTSVAEHVFVARELKRLGVKWVSLAPRFVGEFEKGVDYIGDLGEFERSFAGHVAVAQHFGPYKISIHSGSDKFSIYPIAARLAGNLVHLKTAGTSYLEALRAIAKIDPRLFREIFGFAIERYPTDRASYHVSADLTKVPAPESVKEAELAGVLDQFDAREVLHVTFGSVLTARADGGPRFRDRLMKALEENEEVHYETVRAHIERHVRPFAR